MTYLLDNNVLQYFFNAGRERELMDMADKASIAIVGEVRDEASRGKHGPRARKMLSGGAISIVEIAVDSEVDRTLQSLRPLKSSSGTGERASIALALHDVSLTFVANDHNAVGMALNELHQPGERLLGVPVFLRRMHAASALDPATIDDVMQYWQGRRPTWWPAWRASVEPKPA